MAQAVPHSPAPETRESWSGDPPLRGAAQQRLIDAALRCVVRDGLHATGISAVASEAGVSRPTVYRYFEDRHSLMFAAQLHAGRSLAQRLHEHLRAFRDPGELAVEAMVHVLGQVPGDPLLDALWNSTLLDGEVLADFTRPEGVALARDALARLIEAADWNDAEADEAVEFMLRMLLSLLVAPAPKRDEATLKAFLERRLLPALDLSPRNRKR